MNNFNVVFLALIAGCATFLGVYIGSRKNYGEKAIAFGSAFAAAIMILISAVELIPTAIIQSGLLKSGLYIMLGAGLIAIVNYAIPHLHTVSDIKSCDERCLVRASYLITIGLILHDLPEGFAISSSFAASTTLGFTIIIAAFLHNIPEGYALTIASKHMKGGFSYKSAFMAALAYLIGAILGMGLIQSYGGFITIFLALAAGAMIYISFHELIPLALKHKEKTAMLWGGAVAASLFLVLSYI